jgi:hypothetical protein
MRTLACSKRASFWGSFATYGNTWGATTPARGGRAHSYRGCGQVPIAGSPKVAGASAMLLGSTSDTSIFAAQRQEVEIGLIAWNGEKLIGLWCH